MIYYFYYFRWLGCADVKQPIDRFLLRPVAAFAQSVSDVDKIFDDIPSPFFSTGNFDERLSFNVLCRWVTWFASEFDLTEVSPCCAATIINQSVVNALHNFFSRICQSVGKLQEAFHNGDFDMLYSTYRFYQVAMRCPVQSKHFSNWSLHVLYTMLLSFLERSHSTDPVKWLL